MKDFKTTRIEVILSEIPEGTDYPAGGMERVVRIDGFETYRDRVGHKLYSRDRSVLKRFEDWAVHSEVEEGKDSGDACGEADKSLGLFGKIRLKLLGK